MEVGFQRNVKGSFMVVTGSGEIPEYEERMLRENQVMVLLSFFTICMNSQVQYWYNITGKTSFRDYVEQEGLSADLIRKFFTRLKTAFDRMNGYLIDPDHIVINPDMVYLERVPSDFRVFLTYCPLEREGMDSGIITLTEFLTKQIGPGDSGITDLCFRLYDATLKEQDAFHAVLEVLKDYEVDAVEETPVKPEEVLLQDPPPVRQAAEYSPVRESSKASRLAEGQTDGRAGRTFRPAEDKADGGADRRSPVQIEEDPWGTDDEGGYEEEDGRSFFARLAAFFAGLFASKKKAAGRHAQNLLPVGRDTADSLDFEYDENDTLEQPTVLLSGGADSGGRLVYEGNGSEQDYVLSKEVFRIGSLDEANDAVLHSPVVSRRHARITKSGNSYFIEDLNSRNGTFVNDKMLAYRQTQKLERMDIIRFADVVYKFV